MCSFLRKARWGIAGGFRRHARPPDLFLPFRAAALVLFHSARKYTNEVNCAGEVAI
jgi:hypothetical protein